MRKEAIGVYINVKCGIYLVENPKGEVYIGASRDLPERVRQHKGSMREPGKLKTSMLIHGRKNHKYYLLLELPEWSESSTLKYFENLYIRIYRKDGYSVMNLIGSNYRDYADTRFPSKWKGFYINPCDPV